MNYLPQDWATMRLGVIRWAQTYGELPALWGRQTAPTLVKPFTSVMLTTAPVPDGHPADHGSGVALRVENFTPNTLYRITAFSTNADYTSGATGTVTEIRDALLEILETILPAYAWGTDTIIVSPELGGITVSVAGPLLQKMLSHYLGESIVTFSVDCFAPGRQFTGSPDAPSVDSVEAYSRLVNSLHAPAVIEYFRESGWAYVDTRSHRIMSQVIGGQYEERAGFDLRLRCRTRFSAEHDFVEFYDSTSIEGVITL